MDKGFIIALLILLVGCGQQQGDILHEAEPQDDVTISYAGVVKHIVEKRTWGNKGSFKRGYMYSFWDLTDNIKF